MSSIFQIKFDKEGNNSNTGALSITDLEQNVYKSVNELYSAYVKYIRCNNNSGLAECSPKPTQTELDTKYTAAENSIKSFNNAIESIKTIISKLPQNGQNTDDLNTLMQNYKKVLESRADIDLKLDELTITNTSHGSKTNFTITRYNDSVYAGVLLTAFATSLLYFLFFKMK
jgi:hypothetical protein